MGTRFSGIEFTKLSTFSGAISHVYCCLFCVHYILEISPMSLYTLGTEGLHYLLSFFALQKCFAFIGKNLYLRNKWIHYKRSVYTSRNMYLLGKKTL